MIAKELVKKYQGYQVIYTGWEITRKAPFYGLSKIEPKDYGRSEVVDYEVIDKPYKIVSLGFPLGKGGSVEEVKGTLWVQIK